MCITASNLKKKVTSLILTSKVKVETYQFRYKSKTKEKERKQKKTIYLLPNSNLNTKIKNWDEGEDGERAYGVKLHCFWIPGGRKLES